MYMYEEDLITFINLTKLYIINNFILKVNFV